MPLGSGHYPHVLQGYVGHMYYNGMLVNALTIMGITLMCYKGM